METTATTAVAIRRLTTCLTSTISSSLSSLSNKTNTSRIPERPPLSLTPLRTNNQNRDIGHRRDRASLFSNLIRDIGHHRDRASLINEGELWLSCCCLIPNFLCLVRILKGTNNFFYLFQAHSTQCLWRTAPCEAPSGR